MTKRILFGTASVFFFLLAIALVLILVMRFGNRAPTPVPTSQSEAWPTEVTGSPVAGQGLIDVTKPWTYVGRFKGRIIISVSGAAILHPAEGSVGPEGNGKPADNTFPLPGESAFCAVARFSGHVERVGTYRELFFDSATDLFLGPNDEFRQEHGPGFADNNGSWSYKILAESEIKASRKPRT